MHTPPQRVTRRRGRATARVRAVLAALCLCGVAGSLASGIEIGGDLSIGTWSPFRSSWEAVTPVCVWRGDEKAGPFRILASGLDPGPTFAMRDRSGYRLPYSVVWESGGGRSQPLVSGELLRSAIPGARAPGCAGDPTASIRVRVEPIDIERAPPGVYRDTLMLMISPL